MFIRTSIVAVSLLALGTPAFAMADPVSKMYDLRDLAALLPAEGAAPAGGNPFWATRAAAQPRMVPVLSDIPLLTRFFATDDPIQPARDAGGGAGMAAGGASPGAGAAGSGMAAPVLTSPSSSDNDSPTDRLVGKLCNLLSLNAEELVENVYFVEGDEAGHRRFAETIENVRGLYQDRVQIEVSCYDVDIQQTPNIGDAAPKGDKPAIGVKAVATRKTPTPVQATRSVSYISRWTPIVGDSAVGLEPGTSSVSDGLMLGVRVSGGEEKPRVSVQGTITKAEIASVQVPADQAMSGANISLSPGGPLLTIGLPRVDRRMIDTDVSIVMNRPTVVACVPGFKEGRQLVVVVTIKNVE